MHNYVISAHFCAHTSAKVGRTGAVFVQQERLKKKIPFKTGMFFT